MYCTLRYKQTQKDVCGGVLPLATLVLFVQPGLVLKPVTAERHVPFSPSRSLEGRQGGRHIWCQQFDRQMQYAILTQGLCHFLTEYNGRRGSQRFRGRRFCFRFNRPQPERTNTHFILHQLYFENAEL